MNHTPGPWVEFADKGDTVAIMPAMRDGDICQFLHPYPSRADARLMAAAPAMLEKLFQYAHECATCDGAGEIIYSDGHDEPCEDCADIWDVILRAVEPDEKPKPAPAPTHLADGTDLDDDIAF